jgi:hypothetical protein
MEAVRMKRLALASAGAAAALTIASVTACSNPAPPPPTAGNPFTASPAAGHGPAAGGTSAGGTGTGRTASGPAVAGRSAVAAACKQQYDFWLRGPGQGLVTTVTAFGQPAAGPGALTASLTKAKPVLARASRNPMPTCADPKGYWIVLLMHVNAAAASTGSSSVTTAMRGVPAIARALLVELRHTAA